MGCLAVDKPFHCHAHSTSLHCRPQAMAKTRVCQILGLSVRITATRSQLQRPRKMRSRAFCVTTIASCSGTVSAYMGTPSGIVSRPKHALASCTSLNTPGMPYWQSPSIPCWPWYIGGLSPFVQYEPLPLRRNDKQPVAGRPFSCPAGNACLTWLRPSSWRCQQAQPCASWSQSPSWWQPWPCSSQLQPPTLLSIALCNLKCLAADNLASSDACQKDTRTPCDACRRSARGSRHATSKAAHGITTLL